MRDFTVEGTVVGLGQFKFDNAHHLYSYIDFQSAEGRPIRAENVKVLTDTHSALEMGTNGRFYFDKEWLGPRHLWGIKRDDGKAALHAPSHHWHVTGPLCGILVGGVFSLIIIGLPLLLISILALVPGFLRWRSPSRRQMFYDGTLEQNARLMRLEPIRI